MAENAPEFRVRTGDTDWRPFADGRVWKLTRGVDFPQSTDKARRAFLAWARRHQLAARSKVDGDALLIQITTNPGTKEK
jgi:hypothetical protein